MSDITQTRDAAIAETVARIRTIEKTQGITRKSLDAIKQQVMGLAAQQQLFPIDEFPPPPDGKKGGNLYILSEDEGGRFALYINAINPGHATNPHDHTTWAVVAAVEGQELNKVYRRVDDRSRADYAAMELDREVMVEPGRGIALMPEDVHSIHCSGTRPTRHLHMYGLALEKLDERLAYDLETGLVQPYNRAFLQPTVNR